MLLGGESGEVVCFAKVGEGVLEPGVMVEEFEGDEDEEEDEE